MTTLGKATLVGLATAGSPEVGKSVVFSGDASKGNAVGGTPKRAASVGVGCVIPLVSGLVGDRDAQLIKTPSAPRATSRTSNLS